MHRCHAPAITHRPVTQRQIDVGPRRRRADSQLVTASLVLPHQLDRALADRHFPPHEIAIQLLFASPKPSDLFGHAVVAEEDRHNVAVLSPEDRADRLITDLDTQFRPERPPTLPVRRPRIDQHAVQIKNNCTNRHVEPQSRAP